MRTQYIGLTFGKFMYYYTQTCNKIWMYECILLNVHDEAYKDLDAIVYNFIDLSEVLYDANKFIIDGGERTNCSSFTYMQAYMNANTHYLNDGTLYINDQQFNVKNECVVIR